MMTILRIIFSVLLILGGLLWIGVCVLAGNMADREVDWFKEILLPAAIGLIPIALGLWWIFK